MQGALVDSEGFPRSDIDLYSVRLARNRIICESYHVTNQTNTCCYAD